MVSTWTRLQVYFRQEDMPLYKELRSCSHFPRYDLRLDSRYVQKPKVSSPPRSASDPPTSPHRSAHGFRAGPGPCSSRGVAWHRCIPSRPRASAPSLLTVRLNTRALQSARAKDRTDGRCRSQCFGCAALRPPWDWYSQTRVYNGL